jgi:RNA polymerase sigma factor (sigma-70 family)
METATLTQFFIQMSAGNERGAQGLWEHYFPRLVGIANRVYSGRTDRKIEAEDAALSAFASFCVHARDGRFGVDIDRDNLWRLLKTFTVRKVARQLERDNAAKRGKGRVVTETDFREDDVAERSIDKVFADLPTQDFDMLCAELLAKLPDDELREITLAKLMGYTNAEIASRLQCHERRIERKLVLIRAAFREVMEIEVT